MGKKIRLRKLKRGEHRYIDISGRMRIVIVKNKNYKKWRQKRIRAGRIWKYKEEIKLELKERYKKIITKRKHKIKLKEEKQKHKIKYIKGVKKPIEYEKPKLMWRLTVAINYVVRKEYYSYKVQAWATNKEKLQEKEDELVKKCIEGVEKYLGYKKKDWWTTLGGYFTGKPSISYQQVIYDERLIDEIEEKMESPFSIEVAKKIKNNSLDNPDWFKI